MGSQQYRQRNLKPTRPTWLLYVEGSDERKYFQDLLTGGNKETRVTIKSGGGGSCSVLIQKAIKEMKDGGYDRGWCVLDSDRFPSDKSAEGAVAKASKVKNFHIIFSNPCWEVWLLLHKADCDSSITTDSAKSQVKQRHPNPCRIVEELANDLRELRPVERCRKRRKWREEQGYKVHDIAARPCTDIDILYLALEERR